jgi:rhodanese-related sulfurtransferase
METERIIQFIGNHWMLSSGHFIVSLLLVQDLFDVVTRKYKVASPAIAVMLLNQEDSLVIDVRDPDKYAQGHIEGARNISLLRLKDKLFELESHKNSPILVYCQQGTHAKEACKQLAEAGFSQVHYLDGGILTWQDQKLPLVKRNKKSP